MKCKYPGCTLDRPLLPYEQTFGYHVRPCLNAKHRQESFTRAKWTSAPITDPAKLAANRASSRKSMAKRREKLRRKGANV